MSLGASFYYYYYIKSSHFTIIYHRKLQQSTSISSWLGLLVFSGQCWALLARGALKRSPPEPKKVWRDWQTGASFKRPLILVPFRFSLALLSVQFSSSQFGGGGAGGLALAADQLGRAKVERNYIGSSIFFMASTGQPLVDALTRLAARQMSPSDPDSRLWKRRRRVLLSSWSFPPTRPNRTGPNRTGRTRLLLDWQSAGWAHYCCRCCRHRAQALRALSLPLILITKFSSSGQREEKTVAAAAATFRMGRMATNWRQMSGRQTAKEMCASRFFHQLPTHLGSAKRLNKRLEKIMMTR